MEALVKEIRYIKGIPEELTEKAMEAGEVRKGSTVGLDVEFNGHAARVLIELKLMRDGQEKLVRRGMFIPVEEGSSHFYMTEDWKCYAEKSQDVSGKHGCGAFDAEKKPAYTMAGGLNIGETACINPCRSRGASQRQPCGN